MPEPKLSVVLATLTYPMIEPVIERFRRQTVRDQLEIIFVTPSAAGLQAAMTYRGEFAGMKIVEDPVDDLPTARAAGIRAASADYVFIGETHSYPHPTMCEVLMRHFPERWATVMPAMENGNPKTALSWAAFLIDYGLWAAGLPVGVTANVPLYNGAFRRDVLLALGDRLPTAIGRTDDLYAAFHAGGHRVYFEPQAGIDHLNIAPYGHWITQRFALGMIVGSKRAEDWPLGRRAFYALAAPLIPIVLWRRALPGVRSSFTLKRWPMSIFFWITLGLALKACGEAVTYAGAPGEDWVKRNHEYELNKLLYTDLV